MKLKTSLREMDQKDLLFLCSCAIAFKNNEISHYPNRVVGNLFFESRLEHRKFFIMAKKIK